MICVGWLEGVWAVWGMWHKQQRRASHFLLPHPKFPGFRSGHWGTFFRTFAPPPLLNPLPSRTFTPRPAGHWGSRGGERRCWPLGYTSHLGGETGSYSREWSGGAPEPVSGDEQVWGRRCRLHCRDTAPLLASSWGLRGPAALSLPSALGTPQGRERETDRQTEHTSESFSQNLSLL